MTKPEAIEAVFNGVESAAILDCRLETFRAVVGPRRYPFGVAGTGKKLGKRAWTFQNLLRIQIGRSLVAKGVKRETVQKIADHLLDIIQPSQLNHDPALGLLIVNEGQDLIEYVRFGSALARLQQMLPEMQAGQVVFVVNVATETEVLLEKISAFVERRAPVIPPFARGDQRSAGQKAAAALAKFPPRVPAVG